MRMPLISKQKNAHYRCFYLRTIVMKENYIARRRSYLLFVFTLASYFFNLISPSFAIQDPPTSVPQPNPHAGLHINFTYPATNWNDRNRSQFHMSPQYGWMNDINGPIYYDPTPSNPSNGDGEYHVFFQHNPHQMSAHPLHWGHWVSDDLVHWQQKPLALIPDVHSDMFLPYDLLYSGGAVVDVNNTSGVGANSIWLFTGTQGTKAFYSTDGGDTFQEYGWVLTDDCAPGNTTCINAQASCPDCDTARDYKVFWYEDSNEVNGGHWVMVAYKEDNGTGIKIFTSNNLIDWTYASTLSHQRFYECPDLFPLNISGTSTEKWILNDAAFQYIVGDFDGYTFTPDNSNDWHKWENARTGYGYTYAGLTFENMPNDRRIQMGWNGTNYQFPVWVGSSTFPTELALVQTSNGLRISREPISEVTDLYQNSNPEFSANNIWVTSSGYSLSGTKNFHLYDLEIEFNFALENVDSFGIRFNRDSLGHDEIRYHVNEDQISTHFAGIKQRSVVLGTSGSTVKMRLLRDRKQIDIFSNQGVYSYQGNSRWQELNLAKDIEIFSTGGRVKINNVKVHKINSIHNTANNVTPTNNDIPGPSLVIPPHNFTNGDFEASDNSITGWWEFGDAFSNFDVSTATVVPHDPATPFNHNGNRHLWGWEDGGDAGKGYIISGRFNVSGTGYISFLVSGGNDIDNLFVSVVDTATGQILEDFKATGLDSETYRRVTWDLNAYRGRELAIIAVDNADGGWGHINLDSVILSAEPTLMALENHDFEYGDLRAWNLISGEAFKLEDIYSGNQHAHQGSYSLFGFQDGGDWQQGTLSSENFILGGDGQIDFLIGGGNNINTTYTVLADNGVELSQYKSTGNNSDVLTQRVWNASSLVGEKLAFHAVDNSSGTWGQVSIDDVNVPVVCKPDDHQVEPIMSGFSAISGNWDIHRNCIVGSGTGDRLALSNHTAHNFRYKSSVTILTGNAAALAFRSNSTGSQAYFVTLDIVKDEILLWKSGSSSPVIQFKNNMGLERNRKYQLEVQAIGNSINVWLDGVLELSATDSSYNSAGFFGTNIYNGTAVFQEIQYHNFIKGSWTLSPNLINTTASGDVFLLTEKEADNFVYEAEVKVSSGRAAALIIRGDTNNSTLTQGYVCNIDVGANVVKIWGPGISSTSVGKTLLHNVWYKLRVEAYGNSIKIYVDDTLVVNTSYNNYSSGRIGLNAYNGSAEFRNIRIKK